MTALEKKLTLENEALKATVARQTEVIEKLQQTIMELNQTIAELKEQVNKNSRNSSKPPSSDGLGKAKPKSLRKSSGKKAGGQKGHPGVTLSVLNEPDEVVSHMPRECTGCPQYSSCMGKTCTGEIRHVVDVVVDIHVIAHEALVIECCPVYGERKKAEFPEEIKAAVQYGENLLALAVALNTVGAVSMNRTHEILSGVFGIPISTGTICSMVSRLAAKVKDVVESVRQKMAAGAIGHFDETGARVDGQTCWVHNASNDEYTYLTISRKRGYEGMEAAGVLSAFEGIAVHDCWAPYWKYTNIMHAICCAHLLRELIGVEENHPEQTWARSFIELLLAMKRAKEKAIIAEKGELSAYYYRKFDKLYEETLEMAFRQNPYREPTEKKRGRKKRGKILALADRLKAYKESICLFINNFTVPFDNNQAERDIRMIKTKMKVSGCFRTMQGAADYLLIMSYVGTARKQGVNSFQAIRHAFLGSPGFILD